MVVNVLIVALRKQEQGAGEMAQRLRILAPLPEVPSSIPGTHMVALSNGSLMGSDALFWYAQHSDNIPTYMKYIKVLKKMTVGNIAFRLWQ